MSAGPAALAARSSRSVVCGGLAHLQCLPWSRCEPQHRPVRTLQPGQRRPNISTRGFGDRLLDYIEGGSPRSCCLDACLAGCARAPVLGLYVRKHKRAEDRVCDYHASLYNELAARRRRLRPEAASQKHSKVHLGTSLPHHCLPSGVEPDHCRIPQEFCHRRSCATTTSVPIGLTERSPRHLRMLPPITVRQLPQPQTSDSLPRL